MGTNYYNNKNAVEEYIKAAEGFNGGKLIKKLKEFLPSQSLLLEIGSGPGTDWKILKENYLVTGSDYSENFIQHLYKQFPECEFLQLDAVSLETNKTFDAIYSNKVLHHLTDDELKTSIKRQSDILNDGGIICHSFWKGEDHKYFENMYVNYHTNKEIETLFSVNFEILTMENYQEFEENDSIFFIGRKIY